MYTDQKLSRPEIRWGVVGLAAYALIGGGLTLVGWFAGIPPLTDWFATGISMFPNPAFASICIGAAFVLLMLNRRWSTGNSIFLGLVVTILGGATLFENLSGNDLGIDAVLIKATSGTRAALSPGRMGVPASTSFILLGIALMLIGSRSGRGRRAVPALGLGVCIIAALALLGFAYGADPLYAVARFTGIAIQTASILLALALGVIASVPEYEPMRTLRADSAAGLLARRSLPFIICLPMVLAWLRVRGQMAGWFDTAMGTSLLALVLVILFCALLWWWVGAVAKYEGALRQSQQAEATRRAEVEARQEELRESEALLSAVLKQLPVGLGVTDLAGNWIVSNAIMEQSVPKGIPSIYPDRTKRWRAYDLDSNAIPPENWPGQRALRGEVVSPGQEMLFTDDEGGERWMRFSTAPLRDDAGQIIGVTCVVQDIDEIKRAHDKIAEQARVLELINDAIFVTDEELRITEWNEAAERMFGYKSEETLGRKVSEVLGSPNSPDQRASLVQRALGGEVLRMEIELRRKDGSPIWVDLSGVAQRSGDGKSVRFVSINRDITERKQAAEAVRQSQERLQGIISSAMDAVITIDPQQHIVLFNPAAEKMFGLSTEQAVGKSIDVLIPERFRGSHRRFVTAFGRTGVSSRRMGALGAISGLRADGEEFPIEASISHTTIGGEQLFTVILRDVTERQKAEERMGRLAAIVESSRDAIVGKNLDGIVTSWNPGAEAMFGYSAEEMIGRSIREIIPPECGPEEDMILTRLQAGETTHRETVRMAKDGRRIPISITCSPVKDANGNVIGGSKIARDITEQKETEGKLRDAQRKLLMYAADLEATVAERTAIKGDGQRPSELLLQYRARHARAVAGDGHVRAIANERNPRWFASGDEDLLRTNHHWRSTVGQSHQRRSQLHEGRVTRITSSRGGRIEARARIAGHLSESSRCAHGHLD